MKIFNTVEEWGKYFTKEKQDLYDKVYKEKYGKKDYSKFINDKELSEISGALRFRIPTNKINK
tara:strand:+ start:41612 stop:41800 length:189 start_codon:yes stop_codon:yes gene_type:complete